MNWRKYGVVGQLGMGGRTEYQWAILNFIWCAQEDLCVVRWLEYPVVTWLEYPWGGGLEYPGEGG